MKNRSIVFVMLLSIFTIHLSYGSVEINDIFKREAEAQLLTSIDYIEEPMDNEYDLGFNVYDYLPLDFDPYKGLIYPLDEIDYIDIEEKFEL